MRISDWSSDVCSSDLFDRIAAAEQPETRASLRLDAKIIAHRPHFAGRSPPFAMDALGSVARDDAIGSSAPRKAARRMVGKQRDDARQDRKSTRLKSSH